MCVCLRMWEQLDGYLLPKVANSKATNHKYNMCALCKRRVHACTHGFSQLFLSSAR